LRARRIVVDPRDARCSGPALAAAEEEEEEEESAAPSRGELGGEPGREASRREETTRKRWNCGAPAAAARPPLPPPPPVDRSPASDRRSASLALNVPRPPPAEERPPGRSSRMCEARSRSPSAARSARSDRARGKPMATSRPTGGLPRGDGGAAAAAASRLVLLRLRVARGLDIL
jgi:hypothetical protein